MIVHGYNNNWKVMHNLSESECCVFSSNHDNIGNNKLADLKHLDAGAWLDQLFITKEDFLFMF